MKILPAVFFASLAAFPAIARQDPEPKPSGQVVHLFGPDSITANILPSGTSNGSPQPSSGQAGDTGKNASGGGSAAPSAGDILHDMFVTGDPAQQGKASFPTGRGGTR
ncbi:hypothetical protein [Acidocella sp.]|uniref:hypothetical protein n=1 Tax=Acidocella sp. TaxID=50710 RepID=UPI003D06EAF4